MKVTLKDGSIKEYSGAKTVYEIACDISEGLGRGGHAAEKWTESRRSADTDHRGLRP